MNFCSARIARFRRAGFVFATLLLMTAPVVLLAQKASSAAPKQTAVTDDTAAAPSTATKANSRSALNERQVPFEELKNRVGQRVIIRTIYNTVRSGVLTAYDNLSLDITTDKAQGGYSLSVPRETIKTVSIMLEQINDDPLFPTAGKPGAKKN
jgi:hypothetical protein